MIRSYVGLFGQGKTLSMVNDAIPYLLAGKKVFTNTPFRAFQHIKKVEKKYYPKLRDILYQNDKFPSTLWERMKMPLSYTEVVQKEEIRELHPIFLKAKDFEVALKQETNCLFVIDEASIFFSSYNWSSLSSDYIIRFAQTRKFGVDMFYTSQLYKHTLKRLRDLTNVVVECAFKKLPLNQNLLVNIHWNPAKYDANFLTPKMEQDFILGRKYVMGKQLKTLFNCYDTLFTIDYSANMETSSDLSTSNYRDKSKTISTADDYKTYLYD